MTFYCWKARRLIFTLEVRQKWQNSFVLLRRQACSLSWSLIAIHIMNGIRVSVHGGVLAANDAMFFYFSLEPRRAYQRHERDTNSLGRKWTY